MLGAAGSPEEGVACVRCVGGGDDGDVTVADCATEWTETGKGTRMVGTWRSSLLVNRRSSVGRCHKGQRHDGGDAANGATKVTR